MVLRSLGVATIVAGGALLPACSILFNFDGYGGSDGGDAEAGSTADARGDGHSPGDAGQDARCTGFFDDFDDRDALVGAWTGLNVQGSAHASNAFITSQVFLSKPSSAEFHTPATGESESSTLTLHEVRELAASTVTVDFDVRVEDWKQRWPDASGGGGYEGILLFLVIDSTSKSSYAGGLVLGSDNVSANYYLSLADGGFEQPQGNPQGKPDGQWHHVHWQETFDPTAGSIHVTWDDATIFDRTNVPTVGMPHAPAKVDVWIGSQAFPNVPTLDHYFDNVCIR